MMIRVFLSAFCLATAGLTGCVSATQQKETTAVTSTSPEAVSNADFETTKARLKNAIDARGLTLFNTIDHAAGAANVDLSLSPSTLYIFGNPKAGTPLMQANPALGLHLPLKALVREDNGQVIVSVSDIRALATEPAPVVDRVAGALNAIMTEAAEGAPG